MATTIQNSGNLAYAVPDAAPTANKEVFTFPVKLNRIIFTPNAGGNTLTLSFNGSGTDVIKFIASSANTEVYEFLQQPLVAQNLHISAISANAAVTFVYEREAG